ncbi:MAG: N-methyl-L-tryptophan oxidase [Thermomicrobiales bacterium]
MMHFSTIVIGGGTMGSGAAWELGKRGEKALVLEQFGHVHAMGSHGGLTRIIRHAYAEGADYIPLVRRADDLWVALEEAAGVKVLHRVGGLELAVPGHGHAERARDNAALHGVAFEWLDAAELMRRWPVYRVPEDWAAGYGPDSGFIDVERGLRALAARARAHGIEIREHEPVRSWGATDSGAWVETDQGRYTADRLIVTAGAWAGQMLADLGLPLTVRRKTIHWVEVAQPESFAPERFPVFIADSAAGELYGLPIFGRDGLKIGRHDGGDVTTPETVDREVAPKEAAGALGPARQIFPAITGKVLSSAVCLYTLTPDGDFVIDRHPAWPHVVIAAGFSGHGFKFAPAIGEHLVDMAFHTDAMPFPMLALNRLKALGVRRSGNDDALPNA